MAVQHGAAVERDAAFQRDQGRMAISRVLQCHLDWVLRNLLPRRPYASVQCDGIHIRERAIFRVK